MRRYNQQLKIVTIRDVGPAPLYNLVWKLYPTGSCVNRVVFCQRPPFKDLGIAIGFTQTTQQVFIGAKKCKCRVTKCRVTKNWSIIEAAGCRCRDGKAEVQTVYKTENADAVMVHRSSDCGYSEGCGCRDGTVETGCIRGGRCSRWWSSGAVKAVHAAGMQYGLWMQLRWIKGHRCSWDAAETVDAAEVNIGWDCMCCWGCESNWVATEAVGAVKV